ncbi:hypothetical protein BC940DRAFT_30351 [Gongronella butleri]|nr:hypothetical protein BC940DRAFT_30351 [Gongronella butleri]
MNLLDIAYQMFVKEEFGDDASALVSKLIDLGDATCEDLMLATEMLRQEVDKVITTLVQHNVCCVNEPTAQQVDVKPLSFSLNMNATLARPGKVALMDTAMRAFDGKGVDITKAVYDNGRMTLDSMVKDGLDGPVCYSMIESGYLVPVHAYPVIVISDGNDDQEMQVSTVFYALNFRKFNLYLLCTTLEIFAIKAMDPIAARVIATLFKNTWLQNNREQVRFACKHHFDAH